MYAFLKYKIYNVDNKISYLLSLKNDLMDQQELWWNDKYFILNPRCVIELTFLVFLSSFRWLKQMMRYKESKKWEYANQCYIIMSFRHIWLLVYSLCSRLCLFYYLDKNSTNYLPFLSKQTSSCHHACFLFSFDSIIKDDSFYNFIYYRSKYIYYY